MVLRSNLPGNLDLADRIRTLDVLAAHPSTVSDADSWSDTAMSTPSCSTVGALSSSGTATPSNDEEATFHDCNDGDQSHEPTTCPMGRKLGIGRRIPCNFEAIYETGGKQIGDQGSRFTQHTMSSLKVELLHRLHSPCSTPSTRDGRESTIHENDVTAADDFSHPMATSLLQDFGDRKVVFSFPEPSTAVHDQSLSSVHQTEAGSTCQELGDCLRSQWWKPQHPKVVIGRNIMGWGGDDMSQTATDSTEANPASKLAVSFAIALHQEEYYEEGSSDSAMALVFRRPARHCSSEEVNQSAPSGRALNGSIFDICSVRLEENSPVLLDFLDPWCYEDGRVPVDITVPAAKFGLRGSTCLSRSEEVPIRLQGSVLFVTSPEGYTDFNSLDFPEFRGEIHSQWRRATQDAENFVIFTLPEFEFQDAPASQGVPMTTVSGKGHAWIITPHDNGLSESVQQ